MKRSPSKPSLLDPNSINVKIGIELASARNKLGLSQPVVAARSNISTHTLSEIETGKISSRIEILARVCDSVGVKLHEIIMRWDNARTVTN